MGIDTTAPTQPGTLSANAVSASEVDLSWGASTDNVGVTGYKVERCSGTGCTNFAQIGTTTGTGTTYKDTTVSAPNSYSYRVRATDAAGNLSTYSNVATAATTIGPATKLAFIQGPTDTAVGATITPAVTVAVEDANGNVETSDNATQVSLAIGTNPASGTLSGGSAVTVASGVATFSGLSIDKAGTGYTLTASSTPSYTGATSAAFNITTGAPGWTTYLQGIDRTGFTSDSGFNPASVKNLHLAWQASDTAPNNGIFPQPVVSNGLVYWGSNDGFERATSTSGNLVWQTNLGRTAPPGPCIPSDWGISSTPTITTDVPVGGASSVMYIGGGDSKLYALNAATGAVLWSYDVGGIRIHSSGTRRPCSATACISVSPPSVTARCPGSDPPAQPGHRCAAEHIQRRSQWLHRRWRMELTDGRCGRGHHLLHHGHPQPRLPQHPRRAVNVRAASF